MNIYYRSLASAKAAKAVNLCLEKGCSISTAKLDRLMVLFKCIMIGKYNKEPFRENIELRNGKLVVRGIERDFLVGATGFNEKLSEIIPFLELEGKVLKKVIEIYGDLEAFEIEKISGIESLTKLCEKKKIIRVPRHFIEMIFSKEGACDVDFEIDIE